MSICVVCGESLSKGRRLKTCEKCAASMHRWENRPTADVVQRAQNLTIYSKRMHIIAKVDLDTQEVTFTDPQKLFSSGMLMLGKKGKKRAELKRKATAVVVDIKRRERRRA